MIKKKHQYTHLKIYWARKMILVILIYGITLSTVLADDDTGPEPCDTLNYINEWQRSVSHVGDSLLCDNFLEAAWYRITSGAGERMPTECPGGGFRCNTIRPIYINADAVPPGENVFPGVGQTVDREALSANFDGNCAHETFNIKIKGCNGYLVYHLVPTGGCTTAYCFGDQLPCPAGEYSETGFTPGCAVSADVSVTPYLKSISKETEGINDHGTLMVYSRPVFECHADDLVDDFTYQIRWYVNDLEIEEALTTDLTKTQVESGEGQMLEEHWKTKFKPNMLVNCSIQVGGNGFTVYGPPQASESYFAGLKVKQNSNTDFTVLEGKQLQIPVFLTLPLACEWPKALEGTTPGQKQLKIIQEADCVLVILNGLPKYQTDNQQCERGINDDNVVFESENCGIVFTYTNWKEERLINITGPPDGMITNSDRVVFLRLYNADTVKPNPFLSYWKNIHLPDIKFIIVDSEIATLGTACYSYNDPHMRTFDGKSWELQIRSYGLQPGEYIMYKHDRLPLQVSAYFRQCYGDILCNCGVAVRSGDSIFVANYCGTTYYGRNRVNRYRIQRLCDDQSLIIEKTSSQYTITLPTGTKITFNYGENWVDGIRIIPSILDYDLTSGLCGRYNRNQGDDFTPRAQIVPTTSNKDFAESWQVKGAHADETLFDPEGKLKETEYYGQQYCTCVTNVDDYPHESPEYNCDLTSAMEICRQTRSTAGVYTASCVTHASSSRKKRSVLERYTREVEEGDDDQPPTYPMGEEEYVPATTPTEWINGWTEITARQHCESKFNSAPAYDICTEHVPFIDTEPFIESCILDIKYTGGVDWTKITIRNYASSCLQESKRLANLTSTNSTNTTGFSKPIADIVAELTCLDNCSNHGICIEGECQCDVGFYGELCSNSKSNAPRAIVDAFEDTCDTNKKPCNSILFPANGLVNSPDLKCKLTTVKIKSNGTHTKTEEDETTIRQGTYFNDLYAKCSLHGTRRKRSADYNVVATAYYVSISNNGQNYSETVTTIVFDSACYICNSTTLTCEKQETCPVKETDPEEEESSSSTGLAVGAAIGAVILILVTVAIIVKCLHNKKQKDHYIRDSFVSLPETSRSCPPKAHFVADNDIFLSERFRTKSSLSSN